MDCHLYVWKYAAGANHNVKVQVTAFIYLFLYRDFLEQFLARPLNEKRQCLLNIKQIKK